MRQIAASGVATVIAVACDPPSFAPGAAIPSAAGTRPGRVTPVDRFAVAAPVEGVGVSRQG